MTDEIRAVRRSRITIITIAAGVVLTMLAVYRLPQWTLAIDERFVAPEFAGMQSTFDWLMHLLSFNQTRMTFTGDFFLFRPGLFFVLWLEDFFRDQRWIVNFASVAMYATTMASVFLVTARLSGVVMALGLTMLLMFPSRSYDLPNVSHITPYFIGVTLYFVAFGALRAPVLICVVMFIATLFHEFSVPAILGCAMAFGFRWFVSRDPVALRWLYITSLSVAAFFAVYIINWTLTSPLPFLSAGEGMLRSWKEIASGIATFIANVGRFVLPLPWPDQSPLNLPMMLVLMPIVIVLVLYGIVRFVRSGDPLIAACVSGFLAITFGIAAGRIASRGIAGVSNYYHLFAAMFLIPLMAATITALIVDRVASIAVMITLFLSAAPRAMAIIDAHRDVYDNTATAISTAARIGTFYRDNPSRCHAGVDVSRATFAFAEDIPTMLQRFACGAGTPTYALLNANNEISYRTAHPSIASLTPLPVIAAKQQIVLRQQSVPPGFSFDKSADVTLIAEIAETKMPGLVVDFAPGLTAKGRALYNLRIEFERTSIDLERTSIDLVFTWAQASGERRWNVWLPRLYERARLAILRDQDGCAVFLNDYQLGRIACDNAPVTVRIGHWNTGQPQPRLFGVYTQA